jgi:hypothetical protein
MHVQPVQPQRQRQAKQREVEGVFDGQERALIVHVIAGLSQG